MIHELKNNKRVRQLVERDAAPGERTSRKNIEVSVSGSLEKIYEFYPVVLEEIPGAQQIRIDLQRGMIYKIPAGKQTEFEDLAREHGLELIDAGEMLVC